MFLRINKVANDLQVHYFWPLDSKSKQKLEDMWNEVIKQSGGQVTSETVQVMFGRYFDTLFFLKCLFQLCDGPAISIQNLGCS